MNYTMKHDELNFTIYCVGIMAEEQMQEYGMKV